MKAKTKIRNSIAELLFLAGVTTPELRGKNHLTIVTFHRVLQAPERELYPYPGLAVTPEELDEFLAYFVAHFDCDTLAAQHRRFLSAEVSELPLLALTFDDAQYDNFYNARPVLAKYNLKASFFVPVSAIEQQDLLWHDRLGFAILELINQSKASKQQLKEILASVGLSDNGPGSPVENVVIASKELSLDKRLYLVDTLVRTAGGKPPPEFSRVMTFEELRELAIDKHEIGSHSMTHCMMPECDDRALVYELLESRRILQSKIEQPIESFCYPNGNADSRTAKAVADAGYLRAVTTKWGRNAPTADSFLLRRCDMSSKSMQGFSGNISQSVIALKMSGFLPGLR